MVGRKRRRSIRRARLDLLRIEDFFSMYFMSLVVHTQSEMIPVDSRKFGVNDSRSASAY